MADPRDITQLLHAWRGGDEQARESLFNDIYQNMHVVARQILHGDRLRFALQPTELVNECAMRMFNLSHLDWQDRAHFLALASKTMRRVLVDEARRKQSQKRDAPLVTLITQNLDDGMGSTSHSEVDLESLDDALGRLSELSPELGQIVELKYFGGLTNEEVAEVMATSQSTVKRSWRSAKAWLYADLNEA